MQKDTLNPSFAKGVEIDYFFEEVQNLRIAVVDVDDEKNPLHNADLLGELHLTLAKIVNCENGKMTLPLT